MAPREPEDMAQTDKLSSLEDEEDSGSDVGESVNLLNHFSQEDNYEDMDQEYHTEESRASDVGDEEEAIFDVEGQIARGASSHSQPPLLPAELLKPLPSPAYSLWNDIRLPWDQMSRKEKRTERLRSRKAAKQEWDMMQQDLERLQQGAKDTGALEAGRIAQLRRGIVKARDKIKSGRVEKKTKPQVSGREQLLQDRKRKIEQSERHAVSVSEKTKKKPKR